LERELFICNCRVPAMFRIAIALAAMAAFDLYFQHGKYINAVKMVAQSFFHNVFG
jgi:hypothetical protein